jgi:hypothetical protein
LKKRDVVKFFMSPADAITIFDELYSAVIKKVVSMSREDLIRFSMKLASIKDVAFMAQILWTGKRVTNEIGLGLKLAKASVLKDTIQSYLHELNTYQTVMFSIATPNADDRGTSISGFSGLRVDGVFSPTDFRFQTSGPKYVSALTAAAVPIDIGGWTAPAKNKKYQKKVPKVAVKGNIPPPASKASSPAGAATPPVQAKAKKAKSANSAVAKSSPNGVTVASSPTAPPAPQPAAPAQTAVAPTPPVVVASASVPPKEEVVVSTSTENTGAISDGGSGSDIDFDDCFA